MMNKDPDCAVHRAAHVKCAAEMEAINKLMVMDKLLRTGDVTPWKRYVALLGSIEKTDLRWFFSQHVTGKRLDSITGAAAILTFPLSDMDDIDISKMV